MSLEIEKKYLIRENGVNFTTKFFEVYFPSVEALREEVLENGFLIEQGYLPLDTGKELSDFLGIYAMFNPIEARLSKRHGDLYFAFKDDGDVSRYQLETGISLELFEEYWPITIGNRVFKVRSETPYDDKYTIEAEVFTDDRDLILAEIEVPNLEEIGNLKAIGLDVTNLKRYKSRNLAR